mgnify:FL=1
MARRDVTAVVSGAGWIAGFADKLIRALRQRNVSDEQIHSLVTDEGEIPVGKIAETLAECFNAAKNVFSVVVDYAHTLSKMIQDGHYDSVNDDITADHFPVSGEGVVEVKLELVHFDRVMESDDVLKELDKAGLRPATLAELLAFGAKYPELQRQFPIIALGAVWQRRGSRRGVPALCSSSGRLLALVYFARRWYGPYRFLAFRK